MGFKIDKGVLVKYEEKFGVTEVVIPDGVTSIGERAFSDCRNLTSIAIPEGVTSIGEFAFSSCKSLTNIVIPEGVTSIGKGAFFVCSRLTSIIIPEGVTSIRWGTFNGCRSLTSLIIPEGVTAIENDAFQCDLLTHLVLPDTVKRIEEDAFSYCPSLKEISGLVSSMINGCNVHVKTATWLVRDFWKDPAFLKETAVAYLTQTAKAVNDICEKNLLKIPSVSADIMLELIPLFKGKQAELTKLAAFIKSCNSKIPNENILAIYQTLKIVGAKTAMQILDEIVCKISPESSEVKSNFPHPIEAVCLERFIKSELDQTLKKNQMQPEFFSGVRYKDSDSFAPAFILKCAIVPYMQKLADLPRNIGSYQSDFIKVEPDTMIDEVADTLEPEDLQNLLELLAHRFDLLDSPRFMIPYCRYGSGKQMNDLAALGKKWTNWNFYLAKGRRNIIVLRGAMLLNETREAMFLVEKWGLLDEYARIRNTTADVIRDTVLTEFDLDADGSKHYDLGNAVIAASIGQDLTVTLFNETDKKEVKSLPKRGADPEKYASASEDFADLKKNIKNAVKSRVEKLKEDFVSGRELRASDWKASYLNNYILKRVASLLVWQWKYEGSTTRFMMTMDGTFIGCDGQPVEVSDTGSIAVAHPVEVPAEELECWKTLLTDQQIAQPFVQMFEPICDGDLSATAARYKGIELPMFLLRGLAKEGIVVNFFDYEDYNKIWFNGQATEIVGNVVPAMYFSEKSIAFDAIVKLSDVTIKGKPRAVNHEIYAMDKALIENRVRNGDIAAVQAFSRGITAKTIQHLIDVSIQAEKLEVTAWLMNYKNDHFLYTFADLEL